MQNIILGGVLRGIFKIQQCLVPLKSIFDLFGQKWPARMVTVKTGTLVRVALLHVKIESEFQKIILGGF